jgi:hypothetical protein
VEEIKTRKPPIRDGLGDGLHWAILTGELSLPIIRHYSGQGLACKNNLEGYFGPRFGCPAPAQSLGDRPGLNGAESKDDARQMKYSVSVRTLCEFTAKSGDLGLRFTPAPSAQEVIAGHGIVTLRRASPYQAEVGLAYLKRFTPAGEGIGFAVLAALSARPSIFQESA